MVECGHYTLYYVISCYESESAVPNGPRITYNYFFSFLLELYYQLMKLVSLSVNSFLLYHKSDALGLLQVICSHADRG